MTVSFSQLRMKEIVNVSTGMKIGYADDIELDTETSEVISITVFGRQRAFGLMGRDEDIVIKCSDIKSRTSGKISTITTRKWKTAPRSIETT